MPAIGASTTAGSTASAPSLQRRQGRRRRLERAGHAPRVGGGPLSARGARRSHLTGEPVAVARLPAISPGGARCTTSPARQPTAVHSEMRRPQIRPTGSPGTPSACTVQVVLTPLTAPLAVDEPVRRRLGIFTTADLADHGVGESEIRTAVRSGRVGAPAHRCLRQRGRSRRGDPDRSPSGAGRPGRDHQPATGPRPCSAARRPPGSGGCRGPERPHRRWS